MKRGTPKLGKRKSGQTSMGALVGRPAWIAGKAPEASMAVPATSLGGVESLIEHRATIEGPHSQVPANLLRLSIGLEEHADLIADLEQALAG